MPMFRGTREQLTRQINVLHEKKRKLASDRASYEHQIATLQRQMEGDISYDAGAYRSYQNSIKTLESRIWATRAYEISANVEIAILEGRLKLMGGTPHKSRKRRRTGRR